MHWEDAAKQSKWGKAIGKLYIIHKNRLTRVEVVKPLHGDADMVYYHSGIVLRKATNKEIDKIKKWKPW